MKIEFGSKVLCDGAQYEGTKGKFIGPLGRNVFRQTWGQAPRNYVGEAYALPNNTGNVIGDFSLRVYVEFANASDAQYFYFTHADSLPALDTLTITADDANQKSYPVASIVSVTIEQDGCGCMIDYQFQTGEPNDPA